jgi:hypothetical protein
VEEQEVAQEGDLGAQADDAQPVDALVGGQLLEGADQTLDALEEQGDAQTVLEEQEQQQGLKGFALKEQSLDGVALKEQQQGLKGFALKEQSLDGVALKEHQQGLKGFALKEQLSWETCRIPEEQDHPPHPSWG